MLTPTEEVSSITQRTSEHYLVRCQFCEVPIATCACGTFHKLLFEGICGKCMGLFVANHERTCDMKGCDELPLWQLGAAGGYTTGIYKYACAAHLDELAGNGASIRRINREDNGPLRDSH